MKAISRKEPPKPPKQNHKSAKKTYPVMSLAEVMETINQKCGPVVVDKYGLKRVYDDTDIVVFLPQATKEFKNMVYWGETHPINRYEQIYEGIGHVVYDGNRRIIIVSHFLYIYAAERSPVSACIMNGTYNPIMSRIAYEIEVYTENEERCNRKRDGYVFDPFIAVAGNSIPVLYGHTHPNLGCFFSPPDRTSGFANPNLPAVTFVADPIRMDMKAAVGVELSDAQVIAYSYKETERDECAKEASVAEDVDVSHEDGAESLNVTVPEDLISEIGRSCNKLLSPLYGAKGKFISRTTFTGAQKLKMEMTLKGRSNKEESVVTTKDDKLPSGGKKTVTEGKKYDSYA